LLRSRRKGQTVVEYTMLLIIVLGAFVGGSNYFKRGIQGHWKEAMDDLGDQYDPRFANTSVRHTLLSNVKTNIVSVTVNGGLSTMRTDVSNTVELKKGFSAVGPF